MRVIVLCTGRCGSTTFIRACHHATNYTAGHESRAGQVGPGRLAFPDAHIEADNRFAWLTGELERSHGDDTLYVHLRRDPGAVTRSYLRRWGWAWKGSILFGFAYGILQRNRVWPAERRDEVCRYFVDSVLANIEGFLRDKPNVMEVRLESVREGFGLFWERIEATGDLEAALAEWDVRHNESPPEHFVHRTLMWARERFR